jgi:hypothetical protein
MRLFKDTVKGGDFRAREANVYRLAQISLNIIDQCVAQGVPFAREYGGLLLFRCNQKWQLGFAVLFVDLQILPMECFHCRDNYRLWISPNCDRL